MPTRDLITEKLRNAFAPESLHVEDESHRHEGHAGHRPGGETHFRLYIVSEAFRGKSRIERHRMINAALASELSGGVHALAIHAAAPGRICKARHPAGSGGGTSMPVGLTPNRFRPSEPRRKPSSIKAHRLMMPAGAAK